LEKFCHARDVIEVQDLTADLLRAYLLELEETGHNPGGRHAKYRAVRGNIAGPLFTSLSNKSQGERLSRRALREIVKGHFQAAGVHGDNRTTHSLRHTAITAAIRNHVPAEKVRGMSRHASLDTLMIYYHETDRIDDPAEKYISYE
jgi:integrase/recombinase XerC/integrase/recombinase XerD